MSFLDADIGGIGPFQLHDIAAERLGFPRADIADFSVCVVIPACAGNGIGDGFAKFVRGRGSKRVGDRQSAFATGATRVGHHGIKNVVGGGVVIAAKTGAGFGATLIDLRPRRKENEIQRIGGFAW